MDFVKYFLFIEYVLGVIFVKDEKTNSHKGVVVYDNDEPSHLACVQKALRLKASAQYDGRRCKCIKQDDDQGTHHPGYMYTMAGNLDKLNVVETVKETEKETTKESPFKNVTKLITNQEAIGSYKLVGSLDVLHKNHDITFDVNLTTFESGYRCLILRIAHSNTHSVHVVRVYQEKFDIISVVNGSGYSVTTEKKYDTGTWISFKITQIHHDNDKYAIRTYTINNEEVDKVVDDQPQDFNAVKVYVGGGGSLPPQPGFIRNFTIFQ